MAAPGLREEAACPICLEGFQDPVSIHCGHNFCRGCITECWAEAGARFSCPQCRESAPRPSFRPNRELAKVIAVARRLSAQAAGGARPCPAHREALKLFCREERAPICVVCRESQAHRAHPVVPLEEAAQAYKEEVQLRIRALRDERDELVGRKESEEAAIWEALEQVESERLRVLSECEELRQFLEERERLLLARLQELDEELATRRELRIPKLEAEISRLGELIAELERKCRQPAGEFLQDIQSLLSSEKVPAPREDSSEPEKVPAPREDSSEPEKVPAPQEVSSEPEKVPAPREDSSEPEKVPAPREDSSEPEKVPAPWEDSSEPEKVPAPREDSSEPEKAAPSKVVHKMMALTEALRKFQVDVTLDPDTAHPRLALSPEGGGVRWEDTRRPVPAGPKRFDASRCVLGAEAFTRGRRYWEVAVEAGDAWAVGVARASVRRKGRVNVNPEEGIWAVGQCGAQSLALTDPKIPLALAGRPRVIGVYLDCDEGRVAFFDPEHGAPLYTFPPGSLPREGIHPLLCLGRGARFRLRPCAPREGNAL